MFKYFPFLHVYSFFCLLVFKLKGVLKNLIFQVYISPPSLADGFVRQHRKLFFYVLTYLWKKIDENNYILVFELNHLNSLSFSNLIHNQSKHHLSKSFVSVFLKILFRKLFLPYIGNGIQITKLENLSIKDNILSINGCRGCRALISLCF